MVEWKKLGEVASYYRGVTYNKKQEVSSDSGGTKILRANNITLDSNSLNFDDVKEISSSVKIKDYQWLYANDILICAGSGSKEHVGKVAFIEKDIDYAYGGFMGKLVSSNSIHPRFFFHVISSELFKKYLDVALNSTTINNLNSAIINEFLIPIPSLSEQQRIVSILDTFTSSISNLKQQIEERRKQYEYERDLLLDLEGKEGVEMKKLGEVVSSDCSLSYGIVQPGDDVIDGVPVVRPVDLISNYVKLDGLKKTERQISESYKRTILKGNEILFCVRGTTGIMGLATNELKGCNVTRGIVPISFDDELTKIFVYYQLKGFRLQKVIDEKTNGTALKQINIKDLRLLNLFFPPLSTQSRIVSILDTFEQSIANLEEQLAMREKQYEYYRNQLLTFE